ncbi:MAG: iron export ABC transporter permease subunit FetB [Actinomycetota bacterium]|nr:iron export ABC transporter permease subunit FetB [Actinomycetota bacterium]
MSATQVAVPSVVGVGASVVLVGIAAAVAWRQKLGVTREMLVAAARAGVQLVAVGAILGLLFIHAGVLGALAWVAAMIVVAGQVAARRGKGVPRAATSATMGIATGAASTVGVLLILRVITAEARVIVPVGGMVVAGAMTASAITLRRLRELAHDERPQVEARLALGLPSDQAFNPQLRSALRTALIPNIDGTKVVGLISLPGAMTGLILAGVPPLTAIRYQVVVMWMLLAAAALSALVTGRLAQRALFDPAQRLRPLVDAKK